MNNVFSWGNNSSLQCGLPLPPEAPRRAPDDADDSQRRAHEAEQREQRREQLLLTPTRVPGGVGARCTVQVACGENHTLILDRVGYVWSFGRNREARDFDAFH